jgi:hypothetical protein
MIFPLTEAGTIIFLICFTSAVLDSIHRADLLSNMFYINIHCTALPGGEISGQLVKVVLSTKGSGGNMGGGGSGN